MSIGSSVRLLREAKGLSQQQLADRLNTSQSRVSAIESDKYGERYSLRTLHGLADALGAELVVRFKTKGVWNDPNPRSLGQQPREEIISEQKPKEGGPIKHESGQHEMVETMFQQTATSTFESSAGAMLRL